MGAPSDDEDAMHPTLEAARSNLTSILRAAADVERSLASVESRISSSLEAADVASDAVTPLHSQAIATKALHARINRAVSPALTVLQSFTLVESLERRLLRLSSRRPDQSPRIRLTRLLKYVDTVDRLHLAISSVTTSCDPAVQRLQEAVEFLSRTKATDQLRIHRLRETLGALKSLYEDEVDSMRYEGLLDEALLRLQDEFENLLLQLRHRGIVGDDPNAPEEDRDSPENNLQLGSDMEIDALSRIAQTLATNDCLDICIDIYVKVRYRRAAKALMRLNPDYLKTYAPEEIDEMPWESLETAIGLWIDHFELAVRTVFIAEKRLCGGVLGSIMDGAVWPECFSKVADRIMAVFFRFGEGVARSSKEPQKLFKLLDMFDAMERLRPDVLQVFDGDLGADICSRFRELQKLLVHAASKVYWEFGLQIEEDGAAAPPDCSVPKVVRYAVNYLKCLAAGGYAGAMGRVLQTEQIWKAGFLSRPEPDESLMREAVTSVLDALQRNVEAKRGQYKDKAAAHVFAMNAYWYMYMRARGSELAVLVGEEVMRKRYKAAAEEAAYSYQSQAWGSLVRLLETEGAVEGTGALARGRMEAFMKGLEEVLRRHRGGYCITDDDLRAQIREAVVKIVVPAYARFMEGYGNVVKGRGCPPPETIEGLLAKLFEGGGDGGRRVAVEGGGERGRRTLERRDSGRRSLESGARGDGGGDSGRMSAERELRGGENGRVIAGRESGGGESGRMSVERRGGGRGRRDGGHRSGDAMSSSSAGAREGEKGSVEEKRSASAGVRNSARVARWRKREDSNAR